MERKNEKTFFTFFISEAASPMNKMSLGSVNFVSYIMLQKFPFLLFFFFEIISCFYGFCCCQQRTVFYALLANAKLALPYLYKRLL